MIRNLIGLILLMSSFLPVQSQEVSISSALNLRNYFSYHLLGDVGGKSIVFRDRGYVKEIDVFNTNLELVQSAEVFFEKRRVDIIDISEQDSVFQVLYGYFEKDSMVFNYRRYNNKVELVDSLSFLRLDKRNIRKKISGTTSENKSRILMTTVDEDDNLVFLLFNSKTRSLEWTTKIAINVEERNSIYDIVLADNGDFMMVLGKGAFSGRGKIHSFLLVSPRKSFHRFVTFESDEKVMDNLMIRHDNTNNKWLICGTYSESKTREVQGYFYKLSPSMDLKDKDEFSWLPFDAKMRQELVQGKKKKNRVLNDLTVKDVIFRKDGGFVIISELEREYARRNPYNGYSRSSYGGQRAWIDYYHDDIIVSNYSKQGQMLWNQILYKKQFSQDDDGIYSSFFTMKTPSRLRFVYNDEIKRNNTVSEYLMDPAGKIARNSLLSTKYQKMKLRFQDAIQISSNTMLVPSERSYDLNLVRITY